MQVQARSKRWAVKPDHLRRRVDPAASAPSPCTTANRYPRVFEQLTPQQQADIGVRSNEGLAEVCASVRQMRRIEKDAQGRVEVLDRDVALFAVGPLIAELDGTYADVPEALAVIAQVE